MSTLFGWLGTKFNIPPQSNDETVIAYEDCDCNKGYIDEGGDIKRCENCDYFKLRSL